MEAFQAEKPGFFEANCMGGVLSCEEQAGQERQMRVMPDQEGVVLQLSYKGEQLHGRILGPKAIASQYR